MTKRSALMINRDLDDIKAQVKRELDTIRDLMDSVDYRNSRPGWNVPFQIHRLRRAMRIHYLALKIRDTTPVPTGTRKLHWSLEPDSDWQ